MDDTLEWALIGAAWAFLIGMIIGGAIANRLWASKADDTTNFYRGKPYYVLSAARYMKLEFPHMEAGTDHG